MAMASMPPACAATELVAKGRESAAVLKAMLGQLPAAATPHDGLRDLAEQVHYRKTLSFRRPKPSEIRSEPSEVTTSDGLRRVPSEVTP